MPSPEFQRGSEWRKWDLHVHSPLSILNNQYPKLANGEPDWEPFVERLESLDLAVVGVTDYFTIDGYKHLKELKSQRRLPNIHTLLPNIEFRLSTIISSRGSQETRLNLHVLFSDEIPLEDIEEHFLHDLNFFFQGDPQSPEERRPLKPANLEDLGAELLRQHKAFEDKGISPLVCGAMQAVVNHEDVTRILAGDSRFKGKYLVVLAADGWDQIAWEGQAHLVRKSLLQKSDMVFSPSSKTRDWCLGMSPYREGAEEFVREFKTLKPCIHGSDAHGIEAIGRPCARRGERDHSCSANPSECELRNCWIKADPTFEGLKQLLYEPMERVTIAEANPSPVVSNYAIDTVRIDAVKVNEELAIEGTNVSLNPRLVAVVGGRGTGKTALVDLIANCYVDRCNSPDKNSFVRRIREHGPGITTGLQLWDGGRFSKDAVDATYMEAGRIVYIAQGKLDEYIGEKSELGRHINDLIFESQQIKDSELSFSFHEAVADTAKLEERVAAVSRSIEDLGYKTAPEVAGAIQQEQQKVAADLRDTEARIKALEKLHTKEHTQEATERQARMGTLKSQSQDLKQLHDVLVRATAILSEELVRFNEHLETANLLLRRLRIGQVFARLSYPQQQELEAAVELVTSRRGQVISEIDKEQKELNKLEGGIKEHARSLERKRELEESWKEIQERAELLEKQVRSLAEAEGERQQLTKKLLESVLAEKKAYEDVIRSFSADKAAILTDIDFVAEVLFDEEAFIKRGESILDNRKVEVRGYNGSPSVFEKLMTLAQSVAAGDETKIDELLGEIDRCNREFRTRVKRDPVTAGDFYGFLYGNYMQVKPMVRYKRMQLEKLSLGQKATVLMKIYLAHGDEPIVIDSHDEHLDNEFIMDELVKAVRDAKNRRQVVLVSNNGNVVVNSDADQVIVAARNDVEISYDAGSIENPRIREKALKVLEGGREAFRKRQEKYRIGS